MCRLVVPVSSQTMSEKTLQRKPTHGDNTTRVVYGIGEQKEKELVEIGVWSLYDLACAEVETVASADSISESEAEDFITGAKVSVGYFPTENNE